MKNRGKKAKGRSKSTKKDEIFRKPGRKIRRCIKTNGKKRRNASKKIFTGIKSKGRRRKRIGRIMTGLAKHKKGGGDEIIKGRKGEIRGGEAADKFLRMVPERKQLGILGKKSEEIIVVKKKEKEIYGKKNQDNGDI